MACYVLVHGAFGGAWMWKDIVSVLRAEGHDAYPVTLTGLAERAHLASPEVNLSTHVEDVARLIQFEDLDDVVLVGHSYGGMVITGVADRIPERIAHLVYVDALLPEDGQSVADLNLVTSNSEGWLVAPPSSPPGMPSLPGMEKLTPHPGATMIERLRLSRPTESQPFRRTFIKATRVAKNATGSGSGTWRAAERVRDHPAWTYVEVDTGHVVQHENPTLLAELLLSFK